MKGIHKIISVILIVFLFLLFFGLVQANSLYEKSFSKTQPVLREQTNAHEINTSNIKIGRLIEENTAQEKLVYQKNSRTEKILARGKRVRVSGELVVEHYDFENKYDFENRSQNKYFLKLENGKKIRTYFSDTQGLNSGTRIKVTGKKFGGELVPLSFEVNEVSQAGFSSTGEQRLLVLLSNFQDNQVTPITTEEAFQKVFDAKNFDSVNSYILEASYGKAWLTGDVGPTWYTLEYDQGTLCSVSRLAEEAVAKADEDINFFYLGEQKFDRLMVVIPSGCWWSGSALAGPKTITTKEGEITLTVTAIRGIHNIDDGTGIHELGHNFGLLHANDYECGENVVGETCYSVEYGDSFDPMGRSIGKGHFNAIHKEMLGWFETTNFLQTNTNAVYTIEPIEIPSAGLKALKVLGEDFNYFIEYRRPIGHDIINSTEFGEEIYNGAMIYTDKEIERGDSQLLDMTPRGGSQFGDSTFVVLKENETFEYSNILITTLEVTETYLKVRLGPPTVNCFSHENNWDGSCTAVIDTPFEDGSVYEDLEYQKDTNDIRLNMGKRAGTNWIVHRSYVEWDISSIPDNAEIVDVAMHYQGGYQINSEIWEMDTKPSISDPENIFNQIGNGIEYIKLTAFPFSFPNQKADFGRNANAKLESQLSEDWFAIGMKSSNEEAGSGSWILSMENPKAEPKPTLIVKYTPLPLKNPLTKRLRINKRI